MESSMDAAMQSTMMDYIGFVEMKGAYGRYYSLDNDRFPPSM